MASSHSPTHRISPVSVSQVHTMRLRVGYLNKQQQRYKKNLANTYQHLLKVIENKLNHQQHQNKKLQRLKKLEEEIEINQEKVRVMRDRQQEELKKIKRSYFAMKRQETKQIKDMQKNEKILTLRRQEIEVQRKKEIAERMKLSHQRLKARNQKEIIEKNKLSAEKIKRLKANSKFPTGASKQLQQLQTRARTLAIEAGCNQIYDQQIEQLTQQANKMSIEDFQRIARQMRGAPFSKQEMKKRLAQELLKKKNLASLFYK